MDTISSKEIEDKIAELLKSNEEDYKRYCGLTEDEVGGNELLNE